MEHWIDAKIEPTKTGEYRVKNNSGINGSMGSIDYVVGKGWVIPDIIKPFYKITAWMENGATQEPTE